MLDRWVKTLFSLRGKENVAAGILTQILAMLFRSQQTGERTPVRYFKHFHVGLSTCFVDVYINGMKTVFLAFKPTDRTRGATCFI